MAGILVCVKTGLLRGTPLAVASLAFGAAVAATPPEGAFNARTPRSGPSDAQLAESLDDKSAAAIVVDTLARAAHAYQSQIVAKLSTPSAAGGAETAEPWSINAATRAATRWIMSWISMGRRVYEMVFDSSPAPLAPSHAEQASPEPTSRKPTSQEPASPEKVVASLDTKAEEAARAFTDARAKADADWKVAENAAASKPGPGVKADAAALEAKAEAEARIREREARSNSDLETWREENQRLIAEGLRKLEEFEKAEKARRAEEEKKSEARPQSGDKQTRRADELREAYRAEIDGYEEKRLAEAQAKAAAEAVDKAPADAAEEARKIAEVAARATAEKAAVALMADDAARNAEAAIKTAEAKLDQKPREPARLAPLAQTAPQDNRPAQPKVAAVELPARLSTPVEASVSSALGKRHASAARANKASSTQHLKHKREVSQRHTVAKRRNKALRYYTVLRGDTLAEVADKFYNDRSGYRALRRANAEKIRGSGRLKVGQRLVIPAIH
ncbi:MAG: LysM peptidoglycan-binding domain-containing protein [Hyphomicrobium sp.]|jgi:colicin import membrane protein